MSQQDGDVDVAIGPWVLLENPLVCALLATGYYRGLRFPEWWILEQSNVDNLSGLQRVVNHLCCKTPNI